MPTKKHLSEITGTLSKTTKMPGKSFGLSALDCITGSKLRKVKGSVCEKCYAMKGTYTFPVVKKAHKDRLAKLSDPKWISSIAGQIDSEHFRWHDSGDLQSFDHLINIVAVCFLTPNTKHFLPTKEYGLIRKMNKQGGTILTNIVIRPSSPMIDQGPMKEFTHTSTVHDRTAGFGFICPVAENKSIKSCDEAKCRACWDPSIPNISFRRH